MRLKADIPRELFVSRDREFARMLASRIAFFFGIIAAFLTMNATIKTSAVRYVSTVILGMLFGVANTQIATCAHDVGHNSAIRNRRLNTYSGIALGNGTLGTSAQWWCDKHNRHHESPNDLCEDSDIRFPILAFDIRQVAEKRKIFLPIIKNQHLLFIPLLTLQAINTRIGTIGYLFRQQPRPKHHKAEVVATAIHWGLVALFLYHAKKLGLVFWIVGLAAHGISNGSIFAPNHKGMEIIDENSPKDRLRNQVVTARNVHGTNWFTRHLVRFWYGGLEYQIEHHLFPTMPRNSVPLTTRIVMAHCERLGYPYTSETAWESTKDVYRALRDVAYGARRGDHLKLAKVT